MTDRVRQIEREWTAWEPGSAHLLNLAPSMRLGEEMVLDGDGDGLGAGGDTQLGQDAADVELDGGTADGEPLGNLDIVQALDHEGQDVALTRRQLVSGQEGEVTRCTRAWVASGARVAWPM